MCRAKPHPRRCVNLETKYGRARQNLKAREQYTKRQLNKPGLTAKSKQKLEKALIETEKELTQLEQPYTRYPGGKHYRMNLTGNTEKVLNQLKSDGLTPYIVGGSVRDVLLGLDNKDVDIEVYGGDTKQVIKSLKKIGKVDEVGKSFGVLKVRLGDEDFDISLPRRDSLVGEGHQGFEIEVDPTMTIEEATSRRDFTINALMYDHTNEYIIDVHGGLQDMRNKTLRHVSDAFDEDPLRVLRGVQMASRFGYKLHPDTVEKAKTLKNAFSSLSKERVQIEFDKLYRKGLSAQEGLQVLKETEWDENFPGLKEVNNEKLWDKVERVHEIIENSPELKKQREVYLSATIAHAIPDVKQRKEFLSLTCVGDKTKNAAFNHSIVEHPELFERPHLRHWARNAHRGVTLESWAAVHKSHGKDTSKIEIVAKEAGVWNKIESDLVSGDDILRLANKPAGRWVRSVVEAVRDAQYHEKFSTREDGIAWLEQSGVLNNLGELKK